jgi:integrase
MKIPLTHYLKPVAPNLYRHSENLTYYVVKKINGKKVRHPLNTADRKTADRKLLQWLGEQQMNTPGATPTCDMTVGHLLTAFAAARVGTSKSTQTTEAGITKKMRETFDAKGQGMNLLVSRVRHSHLIIWLATIYGNEESGPKMRHSTYNRHRLFLIQLFDFAVTETIIEHSPFDAEMIPAKGKQRVVRRVPTEAEFKAIVTKIRNPNWPVPNPRKRGGQRPLTQNDAADFAEYLGLAGVGQAEAASIEWPDVDWERGIVKYTRQKTGRPFSHPIYAWLRPLLEKLRAPQKGQGRIFAIKDVRHSLNTAKKRLGYPNFTQRGLRAFLIGRLWT